MIDFGPPKPKETFRRAVQAYQALFNGHGSSQDADIVLADLAESSGFYRVTAGEMPADQVKFAEGQRSVFLNIYVALRTTEEDLRRHEEAASAVTDI